MYAIDNTTLSMMKAEEGFRSYRYKDGSDKSGNDLYSIGYGHQIQPSEIFVEPISESQATDLLKKDLNLRIPYLNAVLPLGLTQNQFNQLLSYSMSFGTARIKEAELYKLIRLFAPEKDVSDHWMNTYITVSGIPSNGLINRRKRQVQAFFRDQYPPQPKSALMASNEGKIKTLFFALFVILCIYLLYITLFKK